MFGVKCGRILLLMALFFDFRFVLFWQDIPEVERKALQIVSYIGCAISTFCLIVAVLFFIMQGYDKRKVYKLCKLLSANTAMNCLLILHPAYYKIVSYALELYGSCLLILQEEVISCCSHVPPHESLYRFIAGIPHIYDWH